jgi:hypothetical protein
MVGSENQASDPHLPAKQMRKTGSYGTGILMARPMAQDQGGLGKSEAELPSVNDGKEENSLALGHRVRNKPDQPRTIEIRCSTQSHAHSKAWSVI